MSEQFQELPAQKLWLDSKPLSPEQKEEWDKVMTACFLETERTIFGLPSGRPAAAGSSLELTDAAERARMHRFWDEYYRATDQCSPSPVDASTIPFIRVPAPGECDCGGPDGHLPNGIHCRRRP